MNSTSRICPSCGEIAPDTAKFCPECGTSLSQQDQARPKTATDIPEWYDQYTELGRCVEALAVSVSF